ncbi:hypothetical protein CP973_22955 [Streptomyces albofaciens JCM 4342]|uniref:hypothetical protein n=1 Tax=Streptomyces albofaciens TaxID=66866 RepID=UPI001238618D|nr:hypothetical protein [Streptomyces albofaciens]KAA6212296.1 hypothetical protein CP973_22955 [Streptomyces albofaciens JCM 4342]
MPEDGGTRSAPLAVSLALIGASATVIAALITTCGHGSGPGDRATSAPDPPTTGASSSAPAPAGWQKTFSGSVLIPSNRRGIDIDADTPRTVPLFTQEDIYAADTLQPDGSVKFFDGAGIAALPEDVPPGPATCLRQLDSDGRTQASVRLNGRFCARSPNGAVLAATIRDVSLVRGGASVEMTLWRQR